MKAYERLIQYVQVNTTSHEENEGVTPSGAGEFNLANLLAQEMRQLGLQGVAVDEHAYCYGFLPPTAGMERRKALGLIAHLDTVNDCGGTDTHPQLIRDYDGGIVPLGTSGKALDPEMFPHLKACRGKTLLTTDGTSVLGADDKAGIAEIMTLCETLIQEGIPHGPISVCFTPDEEIGHGASLLDLDRFGAELAYTCDGSVPNEIEYETFNAASASFAVRGVSVHPGSAKDVMVNASLLAMRINAMLPPAEIPACTEGYEGFFHLTDMRGDVSEAELKYIVRDHDAKHFLARCDRLREIERELNDEYGEGTVTLTLNEQYRNMAEILTDHMSIVELHLRKEGADTVGLGNEIRLKHKLRKLFYRLFIVFWSHSKYQQLLYVDYAYYIVKIPCIYRISGVVILIKYPYRLNERSISVYRSDLAPVRHDILGVLIIKGKDILYHCCLCSL